MNVMTPIPTVEQQLVQETLARVGRETSETSWVSEILPDGRVLISGYFNIGQLARHLKEALMERRDDQILTPEAALNLHLLARDMGALMIWTVTANTTDYPNQVAARPHNTVEPGPYASVLLGDTLEEVRAMLPPGLVRMERDPNDAPAIVEIWL